MSSVYWDSGSAAAAAAGQRLVDHVPALHDSLRQPLVVVAAAVEAGCTNPSGGPGPSLQLWYYWAFSLEAKRQKWGRNTERGQARESKGKLKTSPPNLLGCYDPNLTEF